MGQRFPSFIKLPSNKRFEFKPRFYDPVKEDIDQRVAKIKKEMELKNDGQSNAESLRGDLKASWKKNSRQKSNQRSNIRIAFIALVLAAISYYYFYT